MNNLDSYAIGFIKECYKQGMHAKQASVLLDAVLTGNSGMAKEAGWGSILGKGLLWGTGLAGAGAAGYAAHRSLQEADNMAGRLYRRVFPGGMDLDDYEKRMLKYEPQKTDPDPYATDEWSRRGVYQTEPTTSENTSNDVMKYRQQVLEANKRREIALREKRDEFGNISDADRKAIEDQYAKDTKGIVDNYNRYAVSGTNTAAAKHNYHKAKAMAEASRVQAEAARHLDPRQDYGILSDNPNNKYTWWGRAKEFTKRQLRPVYSGLGLTNSAEDIARYEAQMKQSEEDLKRMRNAVPVKTIHRANNIGDLYR